MAIEIENQVPVEEPNDSVTPPADAQSEIQEYLAVSQQQRRVFPRAALVGLGAGLVAALFRAALAGADALRNALIRRAPRIDSGRGWRKFSCSLQCPLVRIDVRS